MTIWQMNAWKLILAGGPMMAPILLCSLLALTVVIERLIYFASITTDTRKLKQTVFEHIKNNDLKEAINQCENDRSPLAKILKAGIIKFGTTRDEITESMEDVSLFEIPKIERRLDALATIAHISPLLGLLGTVTGIAGSFYTIQVRSTSLTPLTSGDLAGGIWEALLTTMAGLFVAIPAFTVYNYLVHRVNLFILEMERGATELVNLSSQIFETRAAKKGGLKSEI